MRTLKGLLNLTKRNARWIVFGVILLIVIYGYYLLFIRNPYTTDAFLQGNWVQVAARVNGPVVKLFVKNNQVVEKGQALFELDPTDWRLQVSIARGNLRAINQKLAALQETINAAIHLISQKTALLEFAKKELKRFARLVTDDVVSVERFNRAQKDYRALVAEREQAIFELKKAQKQLGTIKNNGERQAAEAALNLALKKLSYTIIKAKVSGRLSNFYIRKGDYIKVGEPLFSIVEQTGWWVEANYLEFELRRIRPGQTASIVLSMYPRKIFTGQITAIGAGISRGRNISTKNTLPIVAESINWLRLFSRFPVFISIKGDPKYPFRVGATAAVIVHVK